MPRIGAWRNPEEIRDGWQILQVASYEQDGTEQWLTVQTALHFDAPLRGTHLTFDDGTDVGMKAGQGHEMFARDLNQIELAAHEAGDGGA